MARTTQHTHVRRLFVERCAKVTRNHTEPTLKCPIGADSAESRPRLPLSSGTVFSSFVKIPCFYPLGVALDGVSDCIMNDALSSAYQLTIVGSQVKRPAQSCRCLAAPIQSSILTILSLSSGWSLNIDSLSVPRFHPPLTLPHQ
jgi:hypothetical protein